MKIKTSYNLDDDYTELEDIDNYLDYAKDDLGDAIKTLVYHKDLEKRLKDMIEDIDILKSEIFSEKEKLEEELEKEAKEELRLREKEYWATQF